MNQKLTFSQRIGIAPISKEIQIRSMDDELRNGLWNCLDTILNVFNSREAAAAGFGTYQFTKLVWKNYYKLPVDKLPIESHHLEQIIRQRFFAAAWNEVYDLLQFTAHSIRDNFASLDYFEPICNKILTREFSAYRFVSGDIAPITNDEEAAEIVCHKKNKTVHCDGG